MNTTYSKPLGYNFTAVPVCARTGHHAFMLVARQHSKVCITHTGTGTLTQTEPQKNPPPPPLPPALHHCCLETCQTGQRKGAGRGWHGHSTQTRAVWEDMRMWNEVQGKVK